MRESFIAVDAATDLRAHARRLRRSWESALGGGDAKAGVRPVIEQSWRTAPSASPSRRACCGRRPARAPTRSGPRWAIDHAVQIFSAEHFLCEQHAWWCSAAPIHDPGTGEVLGVVDLSGPMRTARPHSLALVMAAAEMAENVLRFERVVADSRRREVPVAWAAVVADSRPPLRLRLLGRGRLEARLGEASALELSLRHAEILVLLALHPDGLTCEQLTLHLYGDHGNRVSTRAEMSRLRKLLGCSVAARPYRLAADVTADFLEVEALLAAGDFDGALAAYRGPLLPASDAPRVVQARDELEGALQRAARRGTAQQLGTWLQTESGREDPPAMAEFVRGAGADDPRRAVIAARLRALHRRWQMPA
jgi:hypothetical protein